MEIFYVELFDVRKMLNILMINLGKFVIMGLKVNIEEG